LGEERATLSHHLRVLELAPVVQTLIAQGLLSMSHAKAIAGVQDAASQERLAKLVVSQQLSLKNLERIIAQQLTEQQGTEADASGSAKPSRKPASAHYAELETSLTRQLGLRVQIQTGSKQGTGKLVLAYTNLDEFDKLMEKLGVELEAK